MNERLLTEAEITELHPWMEPVGATKCDGCINRTCEAQDTKTASYFQSVVIPAERAAARKEALDEVEKGIFSDKYVSCQNSNQPRCENCPEQYHSECVYYQFQQLKGGN